MSVRQEALRLLRSALQEAAAHRSVRQEAAVRREVRLRSVAAARQEAPHRQEAVASAAADNNSSGGLRPPQHPKTDIQFVSDLVLRRPETSATYITIPIPNS